MKTQIKKYAGIVLAGTVVIGGIASAAITPIPVISNTFAVAGQIVKSADINKLAESVNILDARTSSGGIVPAGAIMPFNLTACPNGWIAADGTNSTPDLRGEFIRGLDGGRNVDAGRTLASWQAGTAHVYNSRTTGYFGINFPSYDSSDGTESPTGYALSPPKLIIPSTTSYQYLNQGAEPFVASDYFTSRPRNVAFLYCIKQ